MVPLNILKSSSDKISSEPTALLPNFFFWKQYSPEIPGGSDFLKNNKALIPEDWRLEAMPGVPAHCMQGAMSPALLLH